MKYLSSTGRGKAKYKICKINLYILILILYIVLNHEAAYYNQYNLRYNNLYIQQRKL